MSAKPREPQSPDVDENLLRKPWSAQALLVSLVYAPLLTWWLVMVPGGSGPRQVSPSAKIAIAVAFALWLVVLVILRARHQRVAKAALAKMEREAAQAAAQATERELGHAAGGSTRLRIADPPTVMRVGDDAGPTASEGSTGASDEARADGERAEPRRQERPRR